MADDGPVRVLGEQVDHAPVLVTDRRVHDQPVEHAVHRRTEAGLAGCEPLLGLAPSPLELERDVAHHTDPPDGPAVGVVRGGERDGHGYLGAVLAQQTGWATQRERRVARRPPRFELAVPALRPEGMRREPPTSSSQENPSISRKRSFTRVIRWSTSPSTIPSCMASRSTRSRSPSARSQQHATQRFPASQHLRAGELSQSEPTTVLVLDLPPGAPGRAARPNRGRGCVPPRV